MDSLFDVVGRVSGELEGISAQIETISFIAKPVEEYSANAETLRSYISGIVDHITRLISDLDGIIDGN